MTFRNRLYEDYKAHRPPPPDDLIPQFALVREATEAFGVPAIELDGLGGRRPDRRLRQGGDSEPAAR